MASGAHGRDCDGVGVFDPAAAGAFRASRRQSGAGGVGAADRGAFGRHRRRGGLCAGASARTAAVARRGAGARGDARGDRRAARGRARRHRGRLRRRGGARAKTRHHARQPHRHLRRLRAGFGVAAARERGGGARRAGRGRGGADRVAHRRPRGGAAVDVICWSGARATGLSYAAGRPAPAGVVAAAVIGLVALLAGLGFVHAIEAAVVLVVVLR